MKSDDLAIETIENQIKSKLAELKKAEEYLAQLPRMRADLNALQRTLAILKGEERPAGLLPPNLHNNVRNYIAHYRAVSLPPHTTDLFKRELSIPEMVVGVLQEAGRPMSTEEIMAALLVKDHNLGKPSVMGAIYRNAKAGRLFKLVQPGVFALLSSLPEMAGKNQN